MIREAEAGGDPTTPPRAHDLRGAGATIAFSKNVSITDILNAATWRSNTVFASFYLKEFAFETDGLFSRGTEPFVAAGSVIS